MCCCWILFSKSEYHRRRRFKGCLAKELSSLADSDSDEGLSPFLFGSNLAEKIKPQTEINSLSRKIVVSPTNPTYRPRTQMSKGKRRGARQGD